MMYVNGYKNKDTQHKIYQYESVSNSPPKLVTSKNFLPFNMKFSP